jgi:hypothetical protein
MRLFFFLNSKHNQNIAIFSLLLPFSEKIRQAMKNHPKYILLQSMDCGWKKK